MRPDDHPVTAMNPSFTTPNQAMTTMIRPTLAALLLSVALLVPAPEAAAQDYPPTTTYSYLMSLTGRTGTDIIAARPADVPIVYTGEELQFTFSLFSGLQEDESKLIISGGKAREGEAGWTGNSAGMCYMRKQTKPWWQVSHCLGGGEANYKLGAGDYTYVFYWRTKNGEPWKKMNVVHFKIEEIGGGGGRMAKAGMLYTWDHVKDLAALTFDGNDVGFRYWVTGPDPEKGPLEGDCTQFIGIFRDKTLLATGTRRFSQDDCWYSYNSWKKSGKGASGAGPKSVTFKPLDGRGDQGREAFTPKDLTDGAYTILHVNGSWRRFWKFEVKGGSVVKVERQKDDFTPAHYLWFEPNENGKEVYWLTPNNAASQPLNVAE